MQEPSSIQSGRQLTAFRDSWANLLRITTVRIIVQTVFFALFLSFLLLTTFAHLDRLPGLRLWVDKLLEINPLVSIATAVTTHTVYRALVWSLVVLVPTLFLGRVFCNWVCPLGTLHQFVGWMLRRLKPSETADANRYRTSQRVKYFILIAMLAAAVFGSLQIGLLDPIALLHRSFTTAVLPAVKMPLQSVLGTGRLHQGAWLIGFMLVGLLVMNLVQPRFFCRVLCPLGALLGVISRFAWWRIERDPATCNDCNLCVLNCEGACDPHGDLRKSECLVCFNCIEDCPEGALSFKLFPPKEHEVTGADLPRRKVIFAALAGVLFFPFVRASGRTTRNFSSKVIRPPGSVEELEFLQRCIKCDQCVRVCPTNVLQPAWFEAGLEGLWSPILDFRIGHCQLHCTACGQVCPTGAIQRISVERKLGLGQFADDGAIRLGTAHFDTGRCLPYSKNVPCVVCEEVCPTSPKAIYTERQMQVVHDGRKMALSSTADTVTVTDRPSGDRSARPLVNGPARVNGAGRVDGAARALFYQDQWKGDETTPFHVVIEHRNGMTETHRIVSNDADTLRIEGSFARLPEQGRAVTIYTELAVPKIDTTLCIGCGICENKCPVVGDRRAVYITADGESRSENHPDPDRNRSVRLPTP
jgi:polyferredoxin/Pyruvate/2-oxoacid:ferredoxin oxidoreductase delta subunit